MRIKVSQLKRIIKEAMNSKESSPAAVRKAFWKEAHKMQRSVSWDEAQKYMRPEVIAAFERDVLDGSSRSASDFDFESEVKAYISKFDEDWRYNGRGEWMLYNY